MRKKMKNFFVLLVLVAVALSSCTDPNAYKITGEIEGADGKKIVMERVKGNTLEPVDSTTIENGTFEFKGVTEEAHFYTLRAENQMIPLIVAPGEEVEISASFNTMGEAYQISGSRGSELVRSFNVEYNKNLTTLDSLGKIYRENQDKEGFEQIQEKLDGEYKALVEKQRDFSLRFIDENYDCLATLYVLYQQFPPQTGAFVIDPVQDADKFEKVASALTEKYPNSVEVKGLKQFMAQAKQQAERQQQADQVSGEGVTAPDIAQPTPQGDTLRLSSLRGKYVLLDFWAAWCRPCRMENPNLVENYNKYKSKGFEIYQVSLDKTKEQWVAAIQKDNLGQWLHVSDLQYWNSAPAKKYGVQAIPANFLLDPEGKIIARNLRGPALGQKLEEVFSQ